MLQPLAAARAAAAAAAEAAGAPGAVSVQALRFCERRGPALDAPLRVLQGWESGAASVQRLRSCERQDPATAAAAAPLLRQLPAVLALQLGRVRRGRRRL